MYIKYDNQYYKIDTLLSSSIYSLKDNFEKTHNIIINDIYYKNKKLDLENSFFYYNLNQNSILEVNKNNNLNGGKNKLNWFQIIIVIIYLFCVPLILTVGIIPLISSIIEFLITNTVSILLNSTGNSVGNRPKTLLAKIILIFVTILRYIFLYVTSYSIFGFAFLGMAYIISEFIWN